MLTILKMMPLAMSLLLLSAPCALADDLASGITNAVTPIIQHKYPLRFTTRAYQIAALDKVLEEANRVAEELHLPEEVPITKTNIVRAFISPFGYAAKSLAIGNVTTKNYTYFVSQGNKFSYLGSPHQVELCNKFQADYTWPTILIDTNEALALATQWLGALSMDVAGLNRDCSVSVSLDHYYVFAPAGKFVPVYYVSWVKPPGGPGNGVADVRLFTPTKTLLQLDVEDPKYILRPPIVFTNLAELLSQTNDPASNRPPGNKSL